MTFLESKFLFYADRNLEHYFEPFYEFVAEESTFKSNFNKLEVIKLSSRNKTVQMSVMIMNKTVICIILFLL